MKKVYFWTNRPLCFTIGPYDLFIYHNYYIYLFLFINAPLPHFFLKTTSFLEIRFWMYLWNVISKSEFHTKKPLIALVAAMLDIDKEAIMGSRWKQQLWSHCCLPWHKSRCNNSLQSEERVGDSFSTYEA